MNELQKSVLDKLSYSDKEDLFKKLEQFPIDFDDDEVLDYLKIDNTDECGIRRYVRYDKDIRLKKIEKEIKKQIEKGFKVKTSSRSYNIINNYCKEHNNDLVVRYNSLPTFNNLKKEEKYKLLAKNLLEKCKETGYRLDKSHPDYNKIFTMNKKYGWFKEEYYKLKDKRKETLSVSNDEKLIVRKKVILEECNKLGFQLPYKHCLFREAENIRRFDNDTDFLNKYNSFPSYLEFKDLKHAEAILNECRKTNYKLPSVHPFYDMATRRFYKKYDWFRKEYDKYNSYKDVDKVIDNSSNDIKVEIINKYELTEEYTLNIINNEKNNELSKNMNFEYSFNYHGEVSSFISDNVGKPLFALTPNQEKVIMYVYTNKHLPLPENKDIYLAYSTLYSKYKIKNCWYKYRVIGDIINNIINKGIFNSESTINNIESIKNVITEKYKLIINDIEFIFDTLDDLNKVKNNNLKNNFNKSKNIKITKIIETIISEETI